MFNTISNRFRWRRKKMRLVAATVCATMLVVGVGGTIVLAQLKAGNPTSALEIPNVCYYPQSCALADPGCTPAPTALSAIAGPENSTTSGLVYGSANCGTDDCPFPFEFFKCPCGPPLSSGFCPIP